MILWRRHQTRRRYPDIIVVPADGNTSRLEAKVVWGETDIKSIVTRVPRVRPGVPPDPKANQASGEPLQHHG